MIGENAGYKIALLWGKLLNMIVAKSTLTDSGIVQKRIGPVNFIYFWSLENRLYTPVNRSISEVRLLG